MPVNFDALKKKMEEEQSIRGISADTLRACFAFLDAQGYSLPDGMTDEEVDTDAIVATLRTAFPEVPDLSARRIIGKWRLTQSPTGRLHLDDLLNRVTT